MFKPGPVGPEKKDCLIIRMFILLSRGGGGVQKDT